MIRAAIIGMGTWRQDLVEFAKQQGIAIAESYEQVLADPAVDAVMLAPAQKRAAAGQHRPQQARNGEHVLPVRHRS